MTRPVAIDPDRLWSRLMRMAQIGEIGAGGVNRQALSDDDHAAWALMLDWAADLNLEPATDAAANLFLTLPGRDRSLPPILAGSHLDSQPTGGRFDGAVGVLGALEAVTAIVDARVRPDRDITVVAWMNEEGSRFAPGMMGSEAYSGIRPVADIRTATDTDGIFCGDEIDRIHKAFPAVPLRPPAVPAAYIEPHIEQGPVLEQSGNIIGIVTGIQGKVTCEVTLTGTSGHAGTEPMDTRHDAVMAFARVATDLHTRIGLSDPDIRFTIGKVDVTPNAPSVIARKVRFRIDLRHPDNAHLDACATLVDPICAEQAPPCGAQVRRLVHAPSNGFDPTLLTKIRDSVTARGLPALTMASAAGHDARHLAAICPAAMIFIPCRKGLSHDPAEYAEPGHVAAGAQVLLDVILSLA